MFVFYIVIPFSTVFILKLEQEKKGSLACRGSARKMRARDASGETGEAA
jgi:hypothetical protein